MSDDFTTRKIQSDGRCFHVNEHLTHESNTVTELYKYDANGEYTAGGESGMVSSKKKDLSVAYRSRQYAC